jgi:crotonobetainyl-CoA:carnitine CoA-transferase CaiB-like acyl-CoA transferase
MANALEGITVIDLTSYLAGPYGTALLGDLGANVLKVEAPSGDMMRHYPSTLDGDSRAFIGGNRNKRSVIIDLKKPDGLTALRRMVERVDVLVHNFRPSVPKRLGIDYDTLTGFRPNLIYCSLTGYGHSGPLRDHPGYDQMLQCFSGIAALQGDGPEAPQILRGSIVDFYTSSLLAFAVSAALLHRERTGEGQRVDLSLLRSAIALQPGRFIWARGESRDVEREPAAGRVTGAHPTKQGYLYVQASTPRFWQLLCEILGMPQLATDTRYDTVRKRHDRAEEVMPLIKRALLERTAEEWEFLMLGKVPCIAVRGIEEMFDHPQVLAEELVEEHDHPTIGKYLTMTKAVKMGVGDNKTRRAPALGEHTDEVLEECGFRHHEIEALRRTGAVG